MSEAMACCASAQEQQQRLREHVVADANATISGNYNKKLTTARIKKNLSFMDR
jgi:hypothetical protein